MNQQQQGDELATLLKEDIRTSKEVLDEELHRHIKSRTGFLFINFSLFVVFKSKTLIEPKRERHNKI